MDLTNKRVVMDSWLEHHRNGFNPSIAGIPLPDPLAEISNHDRINIFSIASLSIAFQLNPQQHKALTYMATSFLQTLFKKRYKYTTNTAQEQLRMVLFGQAGTGKSAIIKAMQYLAKMFNAEDAFLVMAYTGVAAININGITVDKFIYRNHGYKDLPEKTLTKFLQKHQHTIMMVYDEKSFLAHQDLVLSHHRTTQAFGSLDNSIPFAGIHQILSGDFLQLPKVQSTFMLYQVPIYSFHATNTADLTSRTHALQGFHIYRTFTTVVELTQNMRQQGTFMEQLQRFRDGNFTAEDLVKWNERVIGTTTCPTLPSDISVQTATILNKTRTQANDVMSKLFLRQVRDLTYIYTYIYYIYIYYIYTYKNKYIHIYI